MEWVGALSLAALLFAATGAKAQFGQPRALYPRIPQQPVTGGSLQNLLDAVGESIVVTEDQQDGELIISNLSPSSTYTMQVELAHQASGLETGFYNGHDDDPTLVPVFPGHAVAGWFAVISYRVLPTRAILHVFDGAASLVASTTWLGADRRAIGIYAKGPLGTVYSRDPQNPGSAAHWLFFAGTGLNAGSAWLAVESSPVTGSGGAYDDALWFVEASAGDLTPVSRSSWGRLKARFR